MTTLNLPEPIAAYFDADKRGDADAVASCFTKEAVVKDEGHKARRSGGDPEVEDRGVGKVLVRQPAPRRASRRTGRYVVTSRLTGNFPGSPIDLRYAFRLERGQIVSLEITPGVLITPAEKLPTGP